MSSVLGQYLNLKKWRPTQMSFIS